MTAEALKQAALDHLAQQGAAAFSLPMGDGLWLCVGDRYEIAEMSRSFHEIWAAGDGFPAVTPPQAKEEE